MKQTICAKDFEKTFNRGTSSFKVKTKKLTQINSRMRLLQFLPSLSQSDNDNNKNDKKEQKFRRRNLEEIFLLENTFVERSSFNPGFSSYPEYFFLRNFI